MSEIEVAEIVEPGVVGLYSNTPGEMIKEATMQANHLNSIIEQKKLYTMIRNKKHVSVEGWTTLGAMLGVFPVVEWTHELVDGDGVQLGWEARVEARTLAGAVVGAGEAECRRTEKTWASRDSFSLRSMAQTRATSKALRLPLGFVMTLAGYDATPTEEFDQGHITQAKLEVLALLNGDKTEAKGLWEAALEDHELTEESIKPEHIESLLAHVRESVDLTNDIGEEAKG